MKPWTNAIYRQFITEQHEGLDVTEREMGERFDRSSAAYEIAVTKISLDIGYLGPSDERDLDLNGLITFLQNLGVRPGLEAERLSGDIYNGNPGV